MESDLSKNEAPAGGPQRTRSLLPAFFGVVAALGVVRIFTRNKGKSTAEPSSPDSEQTPESVQESESAADPKIPKESSSQEKDVVSVIKNLYQEATALSKYRFIPLYGTKTERRRFERLNEAHKKFENLPNDQKQDPEIAKIGELIKNDLGDCHYNGRGTPVDKEKAFELWRKRNRIHDLKTFFKEHAILVPLWGLVTILNLSAGLHLGFPNLIKSPFKAQLCAFIVAAAVLSALLDVVKAIAQKTKRPSLKKSYLIFMFSFVIGWICSITFQMAFSVVKDIIPPHPAEQPAIESVEEPNTAAEQTLPEPSKAPGQP